MAAGLDALRAAMLVLGTGLIVSACGGSASAGATLVTGDPGRYLLTINDLQAPGFTINEPAHLLDADGVAAGDSTLAQRLVHDGLQAAAAVRYFKSVDLTTANGPIDIIQTVERFASDPGAADAYAGETRALDAARGAAPISTGALGDEAHAVSIVRTTSGGLQAVQITLEWRVVNVVNVIVVRGRYGAARLDDGLLLAHRVTSREQSNS